jgi:uncharacterized protein YjbJ (UPF0337 family)
MNWDSFQGKFKQLEGSIRQQWAKLSTDDMEMIAGQRERLAGRIQERYGIARDVAEKQADEWWERIQAAGQKPAASPPA